MSGQLNQLFCKANKIHSLLKWYSMYKYVANNAFSGQTVGLQNKSQMTNQLNAKSREMDLMARKSMTKYIRKCVTLSDSRGIDWNQLETHLKTSYGLTDTDVKLIVTPIVCNQINTNEFIYRNNLYSFYTHLKPWISHQTDPLVLTYHFLVLSKLIDRMSEEKTELMNSLLNKIMSSPVDGMDSGLTTRIVVIIRECLLSLAKSSPFNAILSVKLWSIVLNVFTEEDNPWNGLILRPYIFTNELVECLLQKSLVSEALELTKNAYNLINCRLSDKNVEIFMKTLLSLNSVQESQGFLDHLKLTGANIAITLRPQTETLVERTSYECKLVVSECEQHFHIIQSNPEQ